MGRAAVIAIVELLLLCAVDHACCATLRATSRANTYIITSRKDKS